MFFLSLLLSIILGNTGRNLGVAPPPTPPTCGNGVVETGEVCDGAALSGATCATQGFTNGTLACAATCLSYVTSGCQLCGNDLTEGSEFCDGTDLGGNNCTSIEGSFTGGDLGCYSDCTAFNTTRCTEPT